MKTKNILLSILVIVLVIVLEGVVIGYYKKTTQTVHNPIVTMEIADYGTVKIELYPDKAPNTVANFVKLVNEGYYNGLTFHRAISNVLIQGGDKEGTGAGSEDFCIPGEFMANGFEQNNLRHEAGVISMARKDYSTLGAEVVKEGYNSGGAQFFIMTSTVKSFDGLYCAFGKVISGLDIIEKLTNLETNTNEDGTATETITNPPVITSMTVDTFGADYGEPERLEPFDYYSWIMDKYSATSNAN